MYYRFLLAVLPLPVVVFLWSDNAPDVGVMGQVMFSAVLALLSVGAFMDIAIDARGNSDESE